MSTECKLNMSQTELTVFLPSQLLPQPHTQLFPISGNSVLPVVQTFALLQPRPNPPAATVLLPVKYTQTLTSSHQLLCIQMVQVTCPLVH